jgi:hypothetical protein
MPIAGGEKVRWIALVRSTWRKRAINAEWTPCVFPCPAEYDGYGGFRSEPVTHTKEGLKLLLERAGRHYDAEVQACSREITNRSMEIEGHAGQALPVSQIAIREDVWQALLDFPLRRDDGGSLTVEGLAEELETLAYGIARSAGTKPGCVFANTRGLPLSEVMRIVGKGLDEMELKPDVNSPAFAILSEEPCREVFRVMIAKYIMGALTSGELFSFLYVVAEFLYACEVLFLLRFVWRPSNNCGPQSATWSAQACVLKRFAQIAESHADEEIERLR